MITNNKITGINAYAVYLYIKNIHFKNNNHNIITMNMNKFKNKLLNKWNSDRRKVDGFKFKEIQTQYPKKNDLILLFSSYYIKNKNFYIQEIIEDEFNLYKKNVAELNNIEKVLTFDLKSVILLCRENKKSLKDIFIGETSIPKIFKLNLSFNSLIIFNNIFDLINKNKENNINSLEIRRWNDIKINIKKYELIIHQYINSQNWKTIINNCK